MSNTKHAILKKNIDGVIYDLMIKTDTNSVVLEDGETTLDTYLQKYVGTGVQTSQMEEAIKNAIQNLIGGAPEEYQTLQQISEWIDNHEIEYRQLKLLQENKVDKVDGRGLSEEDFTTVLKTKLENFEVYQHPKTHSADMIIETDEKQFISQEEKEIIQNTPNSIEQVESSAKEYINSLAEDFKEYMGIGTENSLSSRILQLEQTVAALEETINTLTES